MFSAIDEVVASAMREQHLPGVAVGVVGPDGTLVHAAGFGVASLELGAPVTPETVFCIGSLTKQFTAAAIMLLVEAGRLTLDDPVEPYVAPLLEGGIVPEGWRPITIRHLLTHTAGLKRDPVMFRPTENSLPPDYIPVLYRWARQDFTPHSLMAELAALPLDFEPPGLKMSYSNAGFGLLGVIIEQASGMAYAEFLAEKILRPLGMTATRLVDEDVIPNMASGYTWTADGWRRGGYVNPTRDRSAGSLVSSVPDLARWDAAWRGDALLPRHRREEMWTRTTLNDGTPIPYGLGWGVGTFAFREGDERRMVGHSGMWSGFTANLLRLPDEGWSVIVLTNLGINGRYPDGGKFGDPGAIARAVASSLPL